MLRLSIAGLALATTLLGSVAHAETQAEIAARENEAGKTLMFEGKYKEAAERFQNASARVPEPKYYFNLCTALFQDGQFGAAITACNNADKNADDKLKGKIAKMVQTIHDEADKQGIKMQPGGGGGGPGDTPPVTDPNTGNPTGPAVDPNNPNQMPPPTGPGPTGQPPTGYAVGRPPDVGLFQAQPPENKYTWSLGFDFLTGGGNVGQKDAFGNSVGGFRLKADYMLNAAKRIGAQGYLQFSHFTEGTEQMATGAQSLDIVDIGVAAYKHLCGPRARGCLTPLVGASFAMMSPNNQVDSSTGEQLFNYGGFGVRAELGYLYALGSRYQHVLGVQVGVNGYTRSFSEPANMPAADLGLDRGGFAGYISFGYTYRFKTPFGSTALFTLE